MRIARTRLGAIEYRVVGNGPPLALIMGYDWTMEGWDPRLVHSLGRPDILGWSMGGMIPRHDHALTSLIPRARIRLYPDAGHGFLFQDRAPFASLIESFLTGHPRS